MVERTYFATPHPCGDAKALERETRPGTMPFRMDGLGGLAMGGAALMGCAGAVGRLQGVRLKMEPTQAGCNNWLDFNEHGHQ